MTQAFIAGIIPVCPVCERGVNCACDEKAVHLFGICWLHGPCSRFARYLGIDRRVAERRNGWSLDLFPDVFHNRKQIADRRKA